MATNEFEKSIASFQAKVRDKQIALRPKIDEIKAQLLDREFVIKKKLALYNASTVLEDPNHDISSVVFNSKD